MVKINGEDKDIAGKNLLEYLNEAGYKSEWVVVERNLTIQDNDEIEVLRFVGGG